MAGIPFNWSAANNPAHVIVGVNNFTGGLLGVVIVGLAFTIAYFRLRNTEPTHESLTAASFVALIVAILLRLINTQGYNVVRDEVVGACVVLFLGSLALLILRD